MLLDIRYTLEMLPLFLEKVPYTLGIVALCFVLGFSLAFFITLGRVNRIPAVSGLLELYVSFIRCIPSVLLLFLVYYGAPVAIEFIFSVRVDNVEKIFFGMLSIILFNGGHMSEILRAAFLSMEKEQLELADSLNYTYLQKLRHVILPQAIPVAIPDLGNALINIMKDTALFFTIGIIDMMGLAEIYIANHYGIRQAEIYLAVALVYWLCSLALTGTVRFFERRWRHRMLSRGITDKT